MNRVWVLGASDPEMASIERLLNEAGEEIRYATSGGRRVHPGTAYKADIPDTDGADIVHRVECSWPGAEGDRRVVVVDHHRPGDPGYGRPPAEFLPASSIGQVVRLLAVLGVLPTQGWEVSVARGTEVPPRFAVSSDGRWTLNSADAQVLFVSDETLFAAAADHCLGAAYRGECPGVEPDRLMRWRIKTRATFQGRDPQELLDIVNQTRARIRELARDGIADLTREPQGTLPEAPEAAAREGIAVLSRVSDKDRREKLVLMSARPDQVRVFLREQEALGRETYGDPHRGFGGAYLNPMRDKPRRSGRGTSISPAK